VTYKLTSGERVHATITLSKREAALMEPLLGNTAEFHGDRLVTDEAEIVYRPRRRAVLILSKQGWTHIMGSMVAYRPVNTKMGRRLFRRICNRSQLPHPLEILAAT